MAEIQKVVEPTKAQLKEQVMQLQQKLQEVIKEANQRLNAMDMSNYFKRLDYLFKVVENPAVFHDDFVGDCADEIEKSLTINTEETTDTKEAE